MALKEIVLTGGPFKGQTFKFGRRAMTRPAPDFHRYALYGATVPQPPATIAMPSYDTTELGMVFLNDQLGDCVIAGNAGHYYGGITSGAGKPFLYTNSQIKEDYHNACGYPPDEGCDIPSVLAYYTSTGFADGTKLLGSCDIDATNQTAVQQAIWITGGVNFGVGLPDAWLNPMPQESGFVWDVVGKADQGNGHDFEGFAYSAQGVIIATWGMWGTVTWAAVAKYASAGQGGELHARVHPGMVNATTGLAPNGMNLNQICTYFNAMGGNVVVPPGPTPVNPPPSPGPTPGPGLTINVPFGSYAISTDGTNLIYTPVTTTPVVGQTVTFPSPVSEITISTAASK